MLTSKNKLIEMDLSIGKSSVPDAYSIKYPIRNKYVSLSYTNSGPKGLELNFRLNYNRIATGWRHLVSVTLGKLTVTFTIR